MHTILVIDDREDIRLSIEILLNDNGFRVDQVASPTAAKSMLLETRYNLILLDMNYTLDTTSGKEGLDFLRWKSSQGHSAAVIAMTAWSNIELVVTAMQLGANDFIEKPWKNRRFLQVIQQQLVFQQLKSENSKLKQQLKQAKSERYDWRSPCMTQLVEDLSRVAEADVNVLLTGENGTGKSEIAKTIHQFSARKNEVMVSVNMGAIAESLFESEMFGHKKGAFTDAKADRIGRFELAEKGTLFLDEIANIPMNQQAKILRVIESGEYEVVGSSETQVTNIRLISATNARIDRLIDKELFREDLYYRLNTLEFNVPPLRDRQQDIIPLAEFFIATFSVKYRRMLVEMSESAKQSLATYHWPGNIREMSHLIERAVLLSRESIIRDEDLRLSAKPQNQSLPFMTLEKAEIQLIKQALDNAQGSVPQAAKLLGLTKSSLYRRMEKHQLDKPNGDKQMRSQE